MSTQTVQPGKQVAVTYAIQTVTDLRDVAPGEDLQTGIHTGSTAGSGSIH